MYKRQAEYGSARWGNAEDIKPYIDPEFQNNIILTQTERLTMNSRPKQPKYARNKNVVCLLYTSMRGEYFNAFACEQLARYFDQRRCKLPIEPVIPFDEESYLNSRGGKVYFDSVNQLLLPLHEGSQTLSLIHI